MHRIEDYFGSDFMIEELRQGEFMIAIDIPSDQEPASGDLMKDLKIGGLFWINGTHSGRAGWHLTLSSIGSARYDQNPVDVLRELIRVKGGTIPEGSELALTRLRAYCASEFRATGPEFHSEGPKPKGTADHEG